LYELVDGQRYIIDIPDSLSFSAVIKTEYLYDPTDGMPSRINQGSGKSRQKLTPYEM
jgi:hypothetical protein